MKLEPGILALVNLGNSLSVDVIDQVEVDRAQIRVQFHINGWSPVNRVVATRYDCGLDGADHWVDSSGSVADDFADFYWGPSRVR